MCTFQYKCVYIKISYTLNESTEISRNGKKIVLRALADISYIMPAILAPQHVAMVVSSSLINSQALSV